MIILVGGLMINYGCLEGTLDHGMVEAIPRMICGIITLRAQSGFGVGQIQSLTTGE